MRLKKHFAEKPEKKLIEKGKRFLAKKFKINPKYLEFQFIWDVTEYGGGKQLHYEVSDKEHEQYRSTLSWVIGEKWNNITITKH